MNYIKTAPNNKRCSLAVLAHGVFTARRKPEVMRKSLKKPKPKTFFLYVVLSEIGMHIPLKSGGKMSRYVGLGGLL